MPKIIVRIVAVFLIPILIWNPVFADIAVPNIQPHLSQTTLLAFTQQALSLRGNIVSGTVMNPVPAAVHQRSWFRAISLTGAALAIAACGPSPSPWLSTTVHAQVEPARPVNVQSGRRVGETTLDFQTRRLFSPELQDTVTRAQAAKALVDLHDRRTIPSFERLLKDPSHALRTWGAYGLEQFGYNAAKLDPSLRPYYDLAKQNWDALSALGESVQPILYWALTADSPDHFWDDVNHGFTMPERYLNIYRLVQTIENIGGPSSLPSARYLIARCFTKPFANDPEYWGKPGYDEWLQSTQMGSYVDIPGAGLRLLIRYAPAQEAKTVLRPIQERAFNEYGPFPEDSNRVRYVLQQVASKLTPEETQMLYGPSGRWVTLRRWIASHPIISSIIGLFTSWLSALWLWRLFRMFSVRRHQSKSLTFQSAARIILNIAEPTSKDQVENFSFPFFILGFVELFAIAAGVLDYLFAVFVADASINIWSFWATYVVYGFIATVSLFLWLYYGRSAQRFFDYLKIAFKLTLFPSAYVKEAIAYAESPAIYPWHYRILRKYKAEDKTDGLLEALVQTGAGDLTRGNPGWLALPHEQRQALLDALASPSKQDQIYAIWMVAHSVDPLVIPQVAPLLESGNQTIREQAAHTVQALYQFFEDTYRRVPTNEDMGLRGDQLTHFWIAMLDHPASFLQVRAIEELSRIGGERATMALAGKLPHTDRSTGGQVHHPRAEVARALLPALVGLMGINIIPVLAQACSLGGNVFLEAAEMAVTPLNFSRDQWADFWARLIEARGARPEPRAVSELIRLDHDRTIGAVMPLYGEVSRAYQIGTMAWDAEGGLHIRPHEPDAPRLTIDRSIHDMIDAYLRTKTETETGRAQLTDAIWPVYNARSFQEPIVRDAADSLWKLFNERGVVSAESFYSSVSRQRLSFLLLAYAAQAYPDYFSKKPIGRLIRLINNEINKRPPEERDRLGAQFKNSFGTYMSMVRNPEERESEYTQLADFIDIVHQNWGIAVEAVAHTGLRLGELDELKRALPNNNALTRILRMLGESPDIEGGYRDVTERLRANGGFPYLYDLILLVCRSKQAAAPIEIGGILEVLRSYGNGVDLWNEADWQSFGNDVRAYYDRGFKVITFQFFTYFREHRNDDEAIGTMERDIKDQTRNIGFGNFFGFNDAFRRRYHLTLEDEIGLVGRYVQITNLSGRDFSRAYGGIGHEIQTRTPASWQNEVPEALRTRYRTRGSVMQLVYQPSSPAITDNLHTLVHRLNQMTVPAESPLSLENWMNSRQEHRDDWLRNTVSALPQFTDEGARQQFRTFPDQALAQRQWLGRWATLFSDTVLVERRQAIQAEIRERVDKGTAGIDDIEAHLSSVGFWEPLSQRAEMLAPKDADVVAAIRSNDNARLAGLFQQRWNLAIPRSQLRDEDAFNSWINRSLPAYMAHLAPRLRNEGAQAEAILRQAFTQARRRALEADTRGIRVQQLTQRLAEEFVEHTKALLDSIASQQQAFQEIEAPSDEQVYTGFFDDLLHLAGEFMATGVCTWDDRLRQVREGDAEGYHFGTLALKSELGWSYGFSQVQLLKTGLRGAPEREANGYHVLALPGINFNAKLPMEQRTAVLTLLQTARQLVLDGGLQAAVIPVDSAIHSNQPWVSTILKELAKEGYLIQGELRQEVTLSKNPSYAYQTVYVIAKDMPGIHLQVASLDEQIARQETIEKRLEKKHKPLFNGLGQIRHNGELSEQEGEALRLQLESILREMPAEVIDQCRQDDAD